MLTDEMKAQGWVEHDGGPCPVAIGSIVCVRFGDGKVDGPCDAHLWEWEWRDDPIDDIIAYKPEQPNG